MNMYRSIVLLPAMLLSGLGPALVAAADLWVHEPFAVSTMNDVTNAPAGGTGWQENSFWRLTNTLNAIDIGLTGNLAMGRLVTSGQALRVSNPNQSSGHLQRGIDVNPPPRRGSFWTSYLVRYEGPTSSGTYQHQQFGWSLRSPADGSYTFASFMLHAGEWDASLWAAADANGKDLTREMWDPAPVSATTYLVVTAVTNVHLPSWSGSEATTLRQWVLDADDFTAVVNSGLLDPSVPQADFMALLDGHNRSVVQEHSFGSWGTGNLKADDLWRFSFDLRNYNPPPAEYILDEIRMGSAFADVLPLVPLPPPGTVLIVR